MAKTIYTQKLADEICSRIADGANLNRLAKLEGFPPESTVRLWLNTNLEFATNYARARENRADARSDRMDSYKRRMLNRKITPEEARVAIDVEKWQAGKENSKKYGDSTQIKHADADGNAFTLDGILAAIDGKTSGLPNNKKKES